VNDKGKIEDLFKEAFENYEEPVRPELWNRISTQIQAPVSTPQAANLAQGGAASIKAGALWIAGAAIVVATGIAVYVNSNNSNTAVTSQQNTENQSSNTIEATELITPSTEISNPANTAENKSATTTLSHKSASTSGLPKTESAIKPEQPAANNSNSGNLSSGETTGTVQPNASQTMTAASPKSQVTENENAVNQQTSGTPASVKRDEIKAYPETGIAPLQVDLSLSGNYENISWEVNGSVVSENLKHIDHIFTEPGTYVVRASVVSAEGKKQEITRSITVNEPPFLSTIPNIFTPNGDGLNDIFKLESTKNIDLEAIIYDQKGSIVKQWTGIENGWDGKLSSGQDAAEGTYFYIIFATSSTGLKQQYKSTLTLKR
jgi:gliding motility-associated-like protein